jgi:DNA primase
MISPQTIQQITSRIDIIDVVGEFVRLKKRGANYLGLCPFHGEKSPSFTVSPSKEIYKCFGCGKSGNTITFLMEHEKYSYTEALRWLAARYNVEIEETQVSDETRQLQQVAESLHIINSFAQKFFSEQLKTEEGETSALSYLRERGFRENILEKFQIGYNPEARDSFTKAALANQFSGEVLLRAGLTANRNEQLVDNYRGRIIFPIHNNTGKIIGFGARVIGKADKAPKYINTPENEIYVKSKILYGSYFARQAIDKADECLLVEGYTDVVSLHQAGIENVVASGGTSLTVDQLRIVKKYTNNLTIIYDGDSAGVKAALRGLDMALEEGLNVKLVLIPDNEDPDSYVNKVGATAFKEFIASQKKDFILFQLEVMLKEVGNDVSKKNEVVNQIAETLSKINKAEDFTKQQEYIKQCSSLLKIDEGGLTNLVNKYIKDRISKEDKIFSNKQVKLYDALSIGKEIPAFDETISFFIDDEIWERELTRVLVIHGTKVIDGKKISDLISETIEQYPMNSAKWQAVVNFYFNLNDQGILPNEKSVLTLSKGELNEDVINLTHSEYSIGKWEKISENYNFGFDENLHRVLYSAINHYKLKKTQRIYLELKEEFQNATNEKDYLRVITIYKLVKQIEMDIAKETGIVYTGFKWE